MANTNIVRRTERSGTSAQAASAALMEGGKIVEIGKPEEIINGFERIEQAHAKESGESL